MVLNYLKLRELVSNICKIWLAGILLRLIGKVTLKKEHVLAGLNLHMTKKNSNTLLRNLLQQEILYLRKCGVKWMLLAKGLRHLSNSWNAELIGVKVVVLWVQKQSGMKVSIFRNMISSVMWMVKLMSISDKIRR